MALVIKGSSSGQITLDVPATAGTNQLTLPATTGEITVGKNTPYFHVSMSASQTVTNNTWVKADYDTVEFQSGVTFDTTNKKFVVPSGEGGLYQMNVIHAFSGSANTTVRQCYLRHYLNGAGVDFRPIANFDANYVRQTTLNINKIVSLSAGDEIEIYGFINVSSGTPSFQGTGSSSWSMFKLIT
jgi:hypothetical protein